MGGTGGDHSGFDRLGVTFLVIYFAIRRLGLERRMAATLGAGGAVCGVAAAIAISGAVGGRRQDASVAITTVILWAIAMIFVLPFVARYPAAACRGGRGVDRHVGIC